MTSEPFRVPLRWRDLDNQGHVYHAEYLTLLDQARTAWLHKCLGMDQPDAYVIAHIDIDYLTELTLDAGTCSPTTVAGEASGAVSPAAVDVTFSIRRLGNKSLTTEETMSTPDGTRIARASAVLLLWNRATRRTRVLSETERDLITPYLATTGRET